MRHGRKTIKLQRRQDHRNALLANLVVSLIEHDQIKTTLAKAKAVRPFAEKLVTLGKRGDLHARRIALGHLTNNKAAVARLFAGDIVFNRRPALAFLRIMRIVRGYWPRSTPIAGRSSASARA